MKRTLYSLVLGATLGAAGTGIASGFGQTVTLRPGDLALAPRAGVACSISRPTTTWGVLCAVSPQKNGRAYYSVLFSSRTVEVVRNRRMAFRASQP